MLSITSPNQDLIYSFVSPRNGILNWESRDQHQLGKLPDGPLPSPQGK